MAKIANPEKSWQRGLPIADALALMDAVEPMLETTDGSFTLEMSLRDGVKIDANSLAELRADVADVSGKEIRFFQLPYTCGLRTSLFGCVVRLRAMDRRMATSS